jgi:Putative DNA-binding domain
MRLDKPLDTLQPTDITALVEAGVAERKVIDYKRDLPGRSDEPKREFLADVTSFANTVGGHILFGMTETGGSAEGAPGVASGDLEADTLWLESAIRDGIAPRIPGIAVRPLEVAQGHHVFILRIPQSWLRPHMVTFKNLSRFFARNSAGKYQLDVGEIRSAFLAAPLAADRVRAFRAQRIATIIAGDLPYPLSDTPKIVLDLVPLDSLDDSHPPHDLAPVREDGRLRPMYTDQPYPIRWNVDACGLTTTGMIPRREVTYKSFAAGSSRRSREPSSITARFREVSLFH